MQKEIRELLAQRKSQDCDTSTLRLLTLIFLHNTVWDLIQIMALFLFCHTFNLHTSILSEFPGAFA